LESLENNGSFEKEEHKETHERKVPIFVQKPKTGGKKLKYKEGSDHVFLINLEEVGDWDRHLVWAPNQISFLFGDLLFNTHRLLVKFDGFLHWVGNLGESFSFETVTESFFLHFNLIGNGDFTWNKFNMFRDNGHNVSLNNILLFVVDGNSHMTALLNLIRLELVVGEEFVRGNGPMVQKQDNAVNEYGEDEHP